VTEDYQAWRDLTVISVLALVWIAVYLLNKRRHRRDEQQQLNALIERHEADERRVRRGLWKLDDRRH
jgi:hypothetical protein